MGQSVGSGLTSITGSVSVATSTTLPAPGTGQTVVSYYGEPAATGATVYTVPANKVLHIYGFYGSNGDNTGVKVLGFTDGTNSIWRATLVYGAAALATGGIVKSLAAGSTVVVVYNGANTSAFLGFWGVLVDA